MEFCNILYIAVVRNIVNKQERRTENRSGFFDPFMDFILGSKDTVSMENRIFNGAVILALFTAVLSLFWNNMLGLQKVLNIVIPVYTIIMSVLYYFSRWKRKYSSLVFLLMALTGLSVLWLISDGTNGSTPILYLITIVLFVALSRSKFHFIVFVITSLNIIALVLLELYFYDELFISYPSEELRRTDIIFSFGATFVSMFALVSFFKRNYDRENESINAQKKKLDETILIKDKFFSLISHDLRGPFNTILGFSDLMIDPEKKLSADEMRQFALLTHNSARNAFGLLENLLEWTKLQQGLLIMNLHDVDLSVVADRAMKIVQPFYQTKDIALSVNVEKGMTVYADEEMLNSIFRNILRNAGKFTPKGGSVSVEATLHDNEMVEVSITDNGIGMDVEMLNSLFQGNEKNNRRGTEGEPCPGLGLMLCQELLKMQTGTISVKSKVDEGSVFSFHLPTKSRN